MSRSFKTETLVIKRFNFGEADRILTLFSKHYGKIRVIAKGVRKLTSRKAGHVELFNQIIVFIVKAKNLDILTEVQSLNNFSSWRRDLNKVAVAYYFCELIDKMTAEEQPHHDVYNLLIDSLKKLGPAKKVRPLVRSFEENLLTMLGFGIPTRFQSPSQSLRPFIEQVTEREIYTPKILKNRP